MRKCVIFAVLATALISSCIGQADETKKWTVVDWRNHLIFINPNFSQSMTSSMGAGLINVGELPVGTYMAFKGEGKTSAEEMEMPSNMTLSMAVLGKEPIKGTACSVIEIVMMVQWEAEDQSSTMTAKGKEWLDEKGTPHRVEGELIIDLLGREMPTTFSLELVGEELYEGHDCWVLQGVSETEIMGVSMGETAVTQYVDKESYAVIRQISNDGETEIDSGYNEAATYVSELKWVLGERETITTDLGTYDCQIIYLQENGKTVGTLWANGDIRAPVKYELAYEMKSMGIEMTMELVMTLVEYTWGT